MPRPVKDAAQGAIDIITGQEIRTCRELALMTQSDLAKATGLSAQQISKYETGKNSASRSKLEIIAIALGKSRHHFAGISPPEVDELQTAFDHDIEEASDDRCIRRSGPLLEREAKKALSIIIRLLTKHSSQTPAQGHEPA